MNNDSRLAAEALKAMRPCGGIEREPVGAGCRCKADEDLATALESGAKVILPKEALELRDALEGLLWCHHVAACVKADTGFAGGKTWQEHDCNPQHRKALEAYDKAVR